MPEINDLRRFMDFNHSKMKLSMYVLLLLAISSFFYGCVASTKVVRNEDVKMNVQDYGELYFIKPDKDPRNVVPQVIDGFKSMGFNVRVVDIEKPIEGAQGTGFLVSDEGHILTCAHVIDEEREATVWIAGVRYEADVLSKDKDADLALLKIRKDVNLNINPLSFRSDKGYKLGEDAFTIGFPMSKLLGSNARLTKGLISSTKGMKDDPKQVQFSAEVQPGNSGGPLFDNNGVVIGVVKGTLNPWKMVQTSGSLPQNVNFAIKTESILDFIKTNNQAVYAKLKTNQNSSLESVESAVVKVRSGIISEDLENKPKLVARVDYQSFWDIWYRFKFFVISVYDFDSQDLLFRAGQGHDNLVSNEEVVIKDTLEQVRKTLNK